MPHQVDFNTSEAFGSSPDYNEWLRPEEINEVVRRQLPTGKRVPRDGVLHRYMDEIAAYPEKTWNVNLSEMELEELVLMRRVHPHFPLYKKRPGEFLKRNLDGSYSWHSRSSDSFPMPLDHFKRAAERNTAKEPSNKRRKTAANALAAQRGPVKEAKAKQLKKALPRKAPAERRQSPLKQVTRVSADLSTESPQNGAANATMSDAMPTETASGATASKPPGGATDAGVPELASRSISVQKSASSTQSNPSPTRTLEAEAERPRTPAADSAHEPESSPRGVSVSSEVQSSTAKHPNGDTKAPGYTKEASAHGWTPINKISIVEPHANEDDGTSSTHKAPSAERKDSGTQPKPSITPRAAPETPISQTMPPPPRPATSPRRPMRAAKKPRPSLPAEHPSRTSSRRQSGRGRERTPPAQKPKNWVPTEEYLTPVEELERPFQVNNMEKNRLAMVILLPSGELSLEKFKWAVDWRKENNIRWVEEFRVQCMAKDARFHPPAGNENVAARMDDAVAGENTADGQGKGGNNDGEGSGPVSVNDESTG